MPYRRLPNTDAARIRAMRIALEKGRGMPPNMMAFSSRTIIKLQKFFPEFEHSIKVHRQMVASQNKKNRDYSDIMKKAKLYLTHFVRVMNMAIFRGDLPSETRAYHGMATNESNVPSLNTEKDVLIWGKRIIEGEEVRIRKGGSPITNPTIAVVKVRYKNFLEARNQYQAILKQNLDHIESTNDHRKEADNLILQLWNEIEATYGDLPEERRKAECENYGIVYFYRKSELTRANTVEV